MLILKEKELCPKSDTCMFAMISGEKCYGACERNSTFVCDLDFATEGGPIEPLLACTV